MLYSKLPVVGKELRGETLVEVIDYGKGEEVTRHIRGISLVFVLRGGISYTTGGGNGATYAGKDEMFIVSDRARFTFVALRAGRLLLYLVPDQQSFVYRVQYYLSPEKKIGSHDIGKTLRMRKLFRKTLDCFVDAIENGFICPAYLSAKMEIILIYITIAYPEEVLAGFFASAVPEGDRYSFDNDNSFMEKVIACTNKVFTVNEMANATNQNRQTFRDNFKRIFGMTPKRWIHEERKKVIISELTVGNRSLQEIADITGFSSERDFYTYCRKEFGRTAISIRSGNQE
ncbi:MAG: helix-turn-helix domain-containing protein [Dysgonamonadaceae bacterium]|jgi:AraC-like DNA-binding protein|nr:helix-turn-helix domain-containing protein [Dysgonamonadaceae bacterium]